MMEDQVDKNIKHDVHNRGLRGFDVTAKRLCCTLAISMS